MNRVEQTKQGPTWFISGGIPSSQPPHKTTLKPISQVARPFGAIILCKQAIPTEEDVILGILFVYSSFDPIFCGILKIQHLPILIGLQSHVPITDEKKTNFEIMDFC